MQVGYQNEVRKKHVILANYTILLKKSASIFEHWKVYLPIKPILSKIIPRGRLDQAVLAFRLIHRAHGYA